MPITLEFHLQSNTNDTFNVTVFERGSSQPLASSQFSFPLSDWMTKHDIAKLEFNPRDPHGRLEELRKFGGKLYHLLFTPAIQQLWQQTRDRAEFLTLCLRMDDAAKGLEALPWEALHDGTEFIAAGAKTTVTRLPLGIVPPRDLPAIPSPLRMLALVSSPPDLPDQMRLNVEAEQEIILEAINAPAGQGKLHIDIEDEAKLAILESSLEAGYHILHFTGHGIAPDNGGGLLLEDPDGKAQVYGAAEILRTLEKGLDTLRLAVISGCNTAQTKTQNADGFRDLARTLAAKKVPAVLAMQFKISDTGGLKLAEVLYPKLVAGQPLEVAVNAARRALWLSDDPVLQGDALALVLIVADGNCLQTKAADAPTLKHEVTIDTKFQLGVLPQLGFGFYGRRKEYRQLRDALRVNNHRAAIIHGIGGIGKTSLSAHAADRLYKRRQRFNGVYAFDCSGGTLAPERMLLDLHRYFTRQGVNELGEFLHQSLEPETLAGFVAQVLMQWPLLLIFDNFETQLERVNDGFRIADEQARRFLAALVKTTSQGTKFLFTSRFVFDLDERLGNVANIPLGDLSRPEAFSVMLKLPRLAKAGYAEKGTIYDTFGGHPFALVALDKYCQTSSVEKALQNAKAVHTKLREHLALELNYGRLTEPARELLNRLAAFRVAVPMEAAEWIAKGTAIVVDQCVRELIEWRLLTVTFIDEGLNTLEVHSLIRDLCRDKQPGVWNDRLREAAGFYSKFSTCAEQSDKIIWDEMNAVELLVEAESFDEACKLLLSNSEYLIRSGFGHYLEDQYRRIKERVSRENLAAISHNWGAILQHRGENEAAYQYLLQSKTIKEELNFPTEERLGKRIEYGHTLHHLGMFHQQRGDYKVATEFFKQAFELSSNANNLVGAAKSLFALGQIAQIRSNYELALDMYEKIRLYAIELEDQGVEANAIYQIGTAYQEKEQFDEALKQYHLALEIYKELGDFSNTSLTLGQIGSLHLQRDELEQAVNIFQSRLKVEEDQNNRHGIGIVFLEIGMAHQKRGDHEQAWNFYHKSLGILKHLQDPVGIANCHQQIGILLTETGHYDEAFPYVLSALHGFTKWKPIEIEKALNLLKYLRANWDGFDAVWREATGGDVPEWMSDEENERNL